MDDDQRYLRRAIDLAARAAEAGDVPIGAVLLVGDRRFEAWNEKERRPDPTAHAEVLLIREAAAALGRWRLSDATLYVTKEPCVMCAGAIVAARIGRVVYGAPDPKGGADVSVFDVLRSPKTNHRLEVTAGVCAAEAAEQLQRFFRERRGKGEEGLPDSPP